MGEGFQIHDIQLALIKATLFFEENGLRIVHNLTYFTLKNRLIEPLIEALAWLTSVFVFI